MNYEIEFFTDEDIDTFALENLIKDWLDEQDVTYYGFDITETEIEEDEDDD